SGIGRKLETAGRENHDRPRLRFVRPKVDRGPGHAARSEEIQWNGLIEIGIRIKVGSIGWQEDRLAGIVRLRCGQNIWVSASQFDPRGDGLPGRIAHLDSQQTFHDLSRAKRCEQTHSQCGDGQCEAE
ncbi:MAG: hypothetical protein GY953_46095, partial [bacterium]|nr:hypothetical protein [bacterium]